MIRARRASSVAQRALPVVMALLACSTAGAQTRFAYNSGQPLEPAYEGWMRNADGSYTLFFGYMNTNWQQEFNIPIGPDNRFEPGNPDLGQPTHFYPRRNPFLFTVTVPQRLRRQGAGLDADRERPDAQGVCVPEGRLRDRQAGDLHRGGRRQRQPGRRRSASNEPPELKVEGALTRTVKVGQPLSLVADRRRPGQPAGAP